MNFPSLNECTIAVIGLGYVGLPLAVEFSKAKNLDGTSDFSKRKVIGFDIDSKRINSLKQGIDWTNETSSDDLVKTENITYTDQLSEISSADVFIITVPTPIDDAKRPNLKPLENASSSVGLALKIRKELKLNDQQFSSPIIIYESTVYPGVTEEVCVPLLESNSGLKHNSDNHKNTFYCGYSPERINPGDKNHKLPSIKKITSGCNDSVAQWIDSLYKSIITAGTYKASSIRVAEAAKVIENTQRDLNIALINELAIIFSKLGIDTLDVLEAASTKWNFLSFKPGLVGGHCIGIDPFYLTYKAEMEGYYPEVVLAGRRINDHMSEWLVLQVISQMAKNSIVIPKSKLLILGLSFKENCPDIRNTKIKDMFDLFSTYDLDISVLDPWVNKDEAKNIYGIDVISELNHEISFDVVIAAVAHRQFVAFSRERWKQLINQNGFIFDLKGIVPRDLNPIRI